jgi:zinc transporter
MASIKIMITTLPDHESLLYSASITPSGIGATADAYLNNPSTDNILWLHLCAINPKTRQWLETETGIDQSMIEAMLAEDTRPRALIRDDEMLVNIRGMNLLDPDNQENMISIRMWFKDNVVITTRRRDILAIEDVKHFIEEGNGPKSIGNFLTMVTERVYARMESYIENLDDCVSMVEEKVAIEPEADVARDIATIRRRNAEFRRHIIPQKLVLEHLIKSNVGWLAEESIESIIESHDKVTRYTEDLNDIRDRVQILNEEIWQLQAKQLNKTAFMFSVAATVFLPLSFFTGLMGINVGGMPGLDNVAGFWIVVVICVLIFIALIIMFRKRHWF